MINILLKTEMLKKGLSGFELARKVGVSDSQFSRYVRGWREVPMEVKAGLAEALNCSVEEIFPEKNGGNSDGPTKERDI